MISAGPPSRWHSPTPSVTKMVWPCGWVCQAVRAPGVKWTSAAANVDVPAGAATASMYTSPVNQSASPFWVSMLLRVICMVTLRSRGHHDLDRITAAAQAATIARMLGAPSAFATETR
jgi:hypothetical protein